MIRIGSALVTLVAVIFLAAGCNSKPQKPTKEVTPMDPDKPPDMKAKKKEFTPPPEKDP